LKKPITFKDGIEDIKLEKTNKNAINKKCYEIYTKYISRI